MLTAETLQALRIVFDGFDGDSDGLLQADEVGLALQCCGVQMSEPEVRASRRVRTKDGCDRASAPAHAEPNSCARGAGA